MNALTEAKKFRIDKSENSWYDLWHTHLDFEGEGNESPEKRNSFIEALFVLFASVTEQAKNWHLPSNIWVLIDPNDSGDDSLYIHTPNPNKNKSSQFPYAFEDVQWGINPPSIISNYIKEIYEVGSSDYNGTLYWVRLKNKT